MHAQIIALRPDYATESAHLSRATPPSRRVCITQSGADAEVCSREVRGGAVAEAATEAGFEPVISPTAGARRSQLATVTGEQCADGSVARAGYGAVGDPEDAVGAERGRPRQRTSRWYRPWLANAGDHDGIGHDRQTVGTPRAQGRQDAGAARVSVTVSTASPIPAIA